MPLRKRAQVQEVLLAVVTAMSGTMREKSKTLEDGDSVVVEHCLRLSFSALLWAGTTISARAIASKLAPDWHQLPTSKQKASALSR
jgi:hypothetical protein